MAKYTLTYPLFGILLVAASCSQEDLGKEKPYSPGDRIEFRASMPEISSRAIETNGDKIDKFQVSSLVTRDSKLTAYFLDKTFEKNAETGNFYSSDPECIWPNYSETIRFVAFAPSCQEMRSIGGFSESDFSLSAEDEITTDYKFTKFSVAEDIADQVDFVTAIGQGSLDENEDTPIDLNFKHQLSRIYLNAWGNSQNFDIEIAGVKFGGVGTEGIFNFTTVDEAEDLSKGGKWESISNGSVEYIYREGDSLVVLDKSDNSPASAEKAVSILGSKVENGVENSAMLIPSNYTKWDHKNNADNGDNHSDGMYFAVLMRVIDTTPYAPGSIVYPYADNKENMKVIYLAVDKESGKKVKTRVYSNEGKYYTDAAFTTEYDPAANDAIVKAFGWAALPVGEEWKEGNVYAYTLNYSSGVGLHQPADANPGDPIISDRVLVEVKMESWHDPIKSDVAVPRR